MYHAACKVEFSTIQSVELTADVFQLFILIACLFYISKYSAVAVSTTNLMVEVCHSIGRTHSGRFSIFCIVGW